MRKVIINLTLKHVLHSFVINYKFKEKESYQK